MSSKSFNIQVIDEGFDGSLSVEQQNPSGEISVESDETNVSISVESKDFSSSVRVEESDQNVSLKTSDAPIITEIDSSGDGSGVDEFIEMNDTPEQYENFKNSILIVNDDEDGLRFSDTIDGGEF